MASHQGFSLNFWWGDSKFFVLVGPRRGRSRMGEGTWQKKNLNWSRNCPPNAKLGHFCYFKHEIQLFKVLLSLRVVKFDTKIKIGCLLEIPFKFNAIFQGNHPGAQDSRQIPNTETCTLLCCASLFPFIAVSV